MPDTQHATGAAVQIGTYIAGFAAAAGALVLGMKRLGSAVKQMTASDAFLEDQERFRRSLHEEMDALRARVSALEDELRHSREETMLYKRHLLDSQGENTRLRADIETLRLAWDPDRTLPPRLG